MERLPGSQRGSHPPTKTDSHTLEAKKRGAQSNQIESGRLSLQGKSEGDGRCGRPVFTGVRLGGSCEEQEPAGRPLLRRPMQYKGKPGREG